MTQVRFDKRSIEYWRTAMRARCDSAGVTRVSVGGRAFGCLKGLFVLRHHSHCLICKEALPADSRGRICLECSAW